MAIEVKAGRLDDPRVIELLTVHVTQARAHTCLGSAHALDVSALQSPDIRLWTAWEGDCLLGTAALRRLSPSHGEVKSMHTVELQRGRGVGSALLTHLI